MNKYRAYQKRDLVLGRDEIWQIAFRLLSKFDLDTLYGVNAVPLADEL